MEPATAGESMVALKLAAKFSVVKKQIGDLDRIVDDVIAEFNKNAIISLTVEIKTNDCELPVRSQAQFRVPQQHIEDGVKVATDQILENAYQRDNDKYTKACEAQKKMEDGKTAAFVLPLLQLLATTPRRRAMRALIIAPTRELVVQIEENVQAYARHLDVQCMTIYGGVGEKPQIAALRQGVDLVVATPGRLLDLMARRLVDFSTLGFLVLDEADRMLDMGFLPAIRKVVAALPASRQTLLFSATFSSEIEVIASELLRNPEVVRIGPRSTPVEAVSQSVIEVARESKHDLLLHLLRDASLQMVLVSSRTKHGADKLARKLAEAGITTAKLHSNRTQGQRLQALKQFRSGEVRVLVATDIAARGIDVDGISHVVNYDFPPQTEDYVHRIGRTARAQAIGDAVSFVTPDEQKQQEQKNPEPPHSYRGEGRLLKQGSSAQ